MSDLGGVILHVHQMNMSIFFFVFKACIIQSCAKEHWCFTPLQHRLHFFRPGMGFFQPGFFTEACILGHIPQIFVGILLLVYSIHVYSVFSIQWIPLFKIKMLLSRESTAACLGFYFKVLADPSIFCLRRGPVHSCKGLSVVLF